MEQKLYLRWTFHSEVPLETPNTGKTLNTSYLLKHW